MELIAISLQAYLDKLNEALGDQYLAQGYKFFASPNRLDPGHVDWVRDAESDPIFIEALQKIESRYRPIVEDIKTDNLGIVDRQPADR